MTKKNSWKHPQSAIQQCSISITEVSTVDDSCLQVQGFSKACASTEFESDYSPLQKHPWWGMDWKGPPNTLPSTSVSLLQLSFPSRANSNNEHRYQFNLQHETNFQMQLLHIWIVKHIRSISQVHDIFPGHSVLCTVLHSRITHTYLMVNRCEAHCLLLTGQLPEAMQLLRNSCWFVMMPKQLSHQQHKQVDQHLSNKELPKGIRCHP